ncbi:heterogeneous nuclear ribonucleoprotein U-like protein 2 [Aplochiton taeniatus]
MSASTEKFRSHHHAQKLLEPGDVLEVRTTNVSVNKQQIGIDSDTNRETQSCEHTDSQQRKEEMEDEEDQSRPILLEEMGRGRAYFEFKEEIRYKRVKKPQSQPEPLKPDQQQQQEDACDLHFALGPDGCSGQPRFWARFPLLWSGCRLSHGVRRGRVSFEVRLEGKLLALGLGEQAEVERDPQPYGLRVGWSVDSSGLQLGEEEMSYCFDGDGTKVTAGKEEDYGEVISKSDIIGCYVSFSEDGSAQLSYCKNGRSLGTAFQVSRSVLRGRTLYPHILSKNCVVQVHLDPTAPPWYPGPPGHTPIAALPARDRLRSPLPPTSKQHCEVLMMVGLPGAGKSHWARAYMKRHPEKRFTLLGTTALLACMRGKGLKESRLQQASRCLTELIKMAAHNPRNYILDQPNVHHSARHHKLLLFEGFHRRAVVVFPAPEEWRRRLGERQQHEAEEIPATALLKLQVSCSFPEQQGEMLEEVQYAELPLEEAQTLLQEYKKEAHRLLPPAPKRQRRKAPANHKRPTPYVPLNTHNSQWDGRKGKEDGWSMI